MCGIAGFIGSHKKDKFKLFNPLLLHFLMIAQDSRGRDNCGIYYRGFDDEKRVRELIQWGHGKDSVGATKTFEDFFRKKKETMLQYAPPFKMIAHSRKASAGSEILDNAHPFKHGNVIGVHNGTLTDWKDLMKHLEVDIDDIDVDSSAIFKAFAEGKTKEFLKMYTGAAALFWTELHDEKDILKVWVGKSTSSTYSYDSEYTYSAGYNTKKEDIERPLHYWETEAGFYISSEAGPLEKMKLLSPVQFEGESIKHFKPNCITTFEDGKIVSVEEIERVPFKSTFTKKIETPVSKHLTPIKKEQATKKHTIEIGRKVDQEIKNAREEKKEGDSEVSSTNFYTPIVHDGLYYRNGNLLDSNIKFTSPLGPLEKEYFEKYRCFPLNFYFLSKVDNYFYYYNVVKNMFTRCDHAVSTRLDDPNIEACYFYKGVKLKGLDAAYTLFKQREVARVDSTKSFPTSEDIAPLAEMPVPYSLGKVDSISKLFICFGVNHTEKVKYYEGNFKYPFTDMIYYFQNGLIDEKIVEQDSFYKLKSSNELEEFRNSFTGKRIVFANPDLIQKDKIWTLCPSCGSRHYFTQNELLRVPTCLSCELPLVLDESLEKELENSYASKT